MLRFRSKSSEIGWTGAGADVTDVDTTSSSMRHRKLPWFVARHQRTLGPFLAASHEHRYDSRDPNRSPREDLIAGAFAVAVTPRPCPAARGAGAAASGRGESAIHDGVLLQGAVGASAGVPPAVPQEPLSAAAEGSGDRAHRRGEDRDAGKPHARGVALGLPRHVDVQELDDGDDDESGRAGDDQTDLARSADVHARGAAAVRDPARALGSSGYRRHADEEMTVR